MIRELRALNAAIPVVLCSGYDVQESTDGSVGSCGKEFDGFLQKPYRLEDLTRALRRALRRWLTRAVESGRPRRCPHRPRRA